MKPNFCQPLARLFVGLFLSCLAAQAQQIIPLSLETIGGSQRLVIYAGINGGAAYPYLFDTGSPGFNAAYYNGPYTGPGSNPFDWASTGTVVADADVYYSDFGYKLNAVYVPTIEIYKKHNLATPEVILSSTSVNPGSPGFVIGQVTHRITAAAGPGDWTNRQGDHFDYDASFTSNMASGAAPLASGLYGTFGAGLFATKNITSPGGTDYVNGSVLGQATTTGWAVIANSDPDHAHAILGLDAGLRSQFTSSVSWTATGADPFPNSNATSSTEFGGGRFEFELSGGGHPAVTWTNGTLLDTGTQNNNLNAENSSASDLALYETHAPLVDAGHTIRVAGDGIASDHYSFQTTTSGLETYHANVKPDATSNDHSTVGIGFFLNKSVAFDLENQQTLYTSAVVPEPGPIFLLGMAGLAVGFRWLRCRRKSS